MGAPTARGWSWASQSQPPTNDGGRMFREKMTVERPFLLIGIALVALMMLAAPLPAFSQSCALCYTQAASAGARMIQALRSGILILIVPPTLMSVGMIFIVYRKRNQVRESTGTADSDAIWKRASLSSSATTPWPPPEQ